MTSIPKCCDHCETIAYTRAMRTLCLSLTHTRTRRRDEMNCARTVLLCRVCARANERASQPSGERERARVYFEWIRPAVRMMCEKRVKKTAHTVMGIADIFNEYASVIWFIVKSVYTSVSFFLSCVLTNMRVTFSNVYTVP